MHFSVGIKIAFPVFTVIIIIIIIILLFKIAKIFINIWQIYIPLT